jgi:hypothetical protein
LHPCLNQCADLWDLDLSSNQLASGALSVLDAARLPKLKSLNLAGNKLESVASLPGPLHSLRSLRLEGNALARLADLAPLREKCPNLRALSLRDMRGDRANPVCTGVPGYRTQVLALLPGLQVLDGERVGAPFYSEYFRLDASTAKWSSPSSAAAAAQPAASATPARPVEDWFGGAGEWKAIKAADVDAELAPRVQVVRSTLSECARLLAQECDQTLREFEKKYPAAAGAGAGAASGGGSADFGEASESPRGNGSSTFGFGEDE